VAPLSVDVFSHALSKAPARWREWHGWQAWLAWLGEVFQSRVERANVFGEHDSQLCESTKRFQCAEHEHLILFYAIRLIVLNDDFTIVVLDGA